MKPKPAPADNLQGDFFRTELCDMIDLHHPLARLSDTVNWSAFDDEFSPLFCGDNGRPAINTRLMVALHYLKYSYDLSDEAVVVGWVENPYWQHFSGMKYFQHRLPINPSSMTRWRKHLGEHGAEKLLEETIKAGLKLKAIKAHHFQNINIDTTVQEKNIRFPTDARSLNRAREVLVREAKARDIDLRQSYKRVGKNALIMRNRYSRARQYKRAKKCDRKLKTYLGRVIRDIERKYPYPDIELKNLMEIVKRIHTQQQSDKNKIYSVHEPFVECIAKGKPHKRYEFGSKLSVAATSRGGWIVGVKAFFDNPYDGKTLTEAVKQVQNLTDKNLKNIYVDQGYRGHDYSGPLDVHVDKPRRGKIPKRLWKRMKRRAAIEPTIGHMKAEHRLDRCRLKGREGDAINGILSAAGMNFAKLVKVLFALIGTPACGMLVHLRRLMAKKFAFIADQTLHPCRIIQYS